MSDPLTDQKERLFARFARYVAIETTADPNSPSSPSSSGQRVLAAKLQEELSVLGIEADIDQFGCLYGRLPASRGLETMPVLGFLAHLDTSPAVSGRNVRPRLHRNYGGGDIALDDRGTVVLSPDTSPALAAHVGHDIVTASGDTLLGADNKAGIAIIMTLLEELTQTPAPHGPIAIAFPPDEEIGRGMTYFQPRKFAADYACTIDGDITGTLAFECFHADSFMITINGRSIHPGYAKGQLANPVRIAADIIRQWPEDRLPETTNDREGFVLFGEIQADAEHATITGIVRDFDLEQLADHHALLHAIIAVCRRKYPLADIAISFAEQYRNMASVIDQVPAFRARILEAARLAGVTSRIEPIRGGTDGARLSFMGIPCPNIFVGGTNFHARDEWVSLDGMAAAVRLLHALVAPDTMPPLPPPPAN